ncbi:hypothetical protein F4811DRAFT_548362 [Daldinia bambusicola]|nr:hypothetical protein F4811DRAFT_548362 [Daldinia bambusicola]
MAEKAVDMSTAAGNAGESGPCDASNGASGKCHYYGQPNKTNIAYIPSSDVFPDTILDWSINVVSLDSSVNEDACNPLPANNTSFNGTIALARIGGCEISVKRTNIAAVGAQYILFYNDDRPYQALWPNNMSCVITAIVALSGEAIIDAVVVGTEVRASFDVDTSHCVGLYDSGGGRPAEYKSWEGYYDLRLQPDVAAPDIEIFSTYPTNQYRGLWAPTTQFGTGFIDAERVLEYSTELGFEGRKFELNNTAHFTDMHSVEITNHGDKPVTYTFWLQAAGGYSS